MKQFILFVLGLIALFVLIGSIGPMILLGVSIWLLYVIFKQFVKADSSTKKIGWVILGLIVLAITLSNVFAVIGLFAAYGLYLILKEYKKEKWSRTDKPSEKDPFINFEKQWAELHK
ncbi:lia operon protein LiaI [Salirhabdus euzebyi]|uniref:Lia operon protein LiaI n=1 Tax=Salirhabdus euzebyi TaxID=394506 RepID=A0A841Q6X1_9BACI|nr:flagellar basal body rod protein [Salirhabdus euzebyi]MBB6454067.1 lia operon protein LiaI [Salirhabdus euzebyi]